MNTLKKLIALLLLAMISTTAFAVTDAQVFAYAEANYSSLFAGTVTAGQYQQYDYRYYSASRNYLAVDNTRMIHILGTYTNGVITAVGTVSSFANAIIAWEQATTPTTDNSDCSTFYVPGRVLTLDYSTSVPEIPTHTGTIVRSFGADTTFLGQPVKQVIDQNITDTPAVTTSLYIQDLSTEWIELGSTSTWSGGSSTATYQPAVHTAKQWAIGQTVTYSGQLIIAGQPTLNTTVQYITTLVRRESVTVPAGTFDACLFHTDSTSSNFSGTAQGSSDTWIAPNVGEVKMVNTSGTSTNTYVLRQVQ